MKKAQQMQLQKEWEDLMKTHSKPLERGAKAKGVKSSFKPKATKVVEIHRAKSNSNAMMGIAAKEPPKVYTGTKMIGISTMHKSNLVPVFSSEEASDIAKMRRG